MREDRSSRPAAPGVRDRPACRTRVWLGSRAVLRRVARCPEGTAQCGWAPALASFSTGMAFPILNDNEEKRLLLSGQGLASQWCKSWFKSKADDHGQRRASRLPQTANSPHLCCLSFHSGRGSPTLVRASRFTRPLRSLIHMLTPFFRKQPHRHTRNVRQLPGRPTALSR